MEKEQRKDRILATPSHYRPTSAVPCSIDKRHMRIIAGAGAGKTGTVTSRIVCHLIYEQIDPAGSMSFFAMANALRSGITDLQRSTTHDDSAIQVQMYALGMSMTGETVSKGSVAYLDDASLREVGVSESHLTSAKEAVERPSQA